MTPDAIVTTLAGKAGDSGSDDGIGSDARFYGPSGVSADGAEIFMSLILPIARSVRFYRVQW